MSLNKTASSRRRLMQLDLIAVRRSPSLRIASRNRWRQQASRDIQPHSDHFFKDGHERLYDDVACYGVECARVCVEINKSRVDQTHEDEGDAGCDSNDDRLLALGDGAQLGKIVHQSDSG